MHQAGKLPHPNHARPRASPQRPPASRPPATSRTLLAGLAAAASSVAHGGCYEPLDELASIHYRFDGARYLCAVNIDDSVRVSQTSIAAGIAYAAQHQTALQLFAHTPGTTVSVARLRATLAAAAHAGLVTLTYPEMLALTVPPPTGALVLSFDDAGIGAWHAMRPMFSEYRTKASFFVTRFAHATTAERQQLAELARDGHAVEAHGVAHLRAPEFVEAHGVAAYLREEALPSLTVLRDAGFAPTLFAYPFGASTQEIDRALLSDVAAIRAVAFASAAPGVVDPCAR